jgi:phosphoribosylamine--glycine ligase
VFHAGTRRDGDRILTDAGRVLSVTALGDTLADAKRRAYEAAACLHFPGAFYRRDIADKALRSLAAPAQAPTPSAATEQPPS